MKILKRMGNEALQMKDGLNVTLLDQAVILGKADVVNALIKAGAKPDKDTLSWARVCGETTILENHLLPAMQDMLEEEKTQCLIKTREVAEGLQDWNQELLPEEKYERFFALCSSYKAAKSKDQVRQIFGWMSILVKQGVQIDSVQSRNLSPLHCVAQNNNSTALKALILLGADVNKGAAKDKSDERSSTYCEGVTPLHLACNSRPEPETVKLLLAAGADVNASDSRGSNALHYLMNWPSNERAAKIAEIIDLLLAAGISIDKRDKNGCTALNRACRTGEWGAAKKLIRAGAEVASAANSSNPDLKKRTALHWAAAKPGGIEVVKLIIERENAPLNKRDSDNATPHTVARDADNLNTMILLTPLYRDSLAQQE